jgi:hypothetical protein
MLIHSALVSWQLAQPLLTPVWIAPAVGAGSKKPLPGAVLVATAGTKLAGVLPRWQLSHWVELGRCELAPTGEVGGITTILLMP